MTREPVLPGWAKELRNRYLAGEASMFLVHGNVRDLVPWDGQDAVTYVPVRTFLERFLVRSKEIVAYYNCSEGFEVPDRAHRARFLRAVNTRRALDGRSGVDELPRSPSEALPLVEALVTDPAQRAGVVLDYVETVVPNGDLSFMGEADKANLVALQRFASDPGLLASDNLLILLTENLADVHRRVVSSPQLVAVHLPLPDEAERLAFLRSLPRRGVTLEMGEEVLAAVTAGLSLVQIRGLFRQA
jgi:hypothetical protein